MKRPVLPIIAVVCAAATLGSRVPAAENPPAPKVQEESLEAIEERLKQAELLAGLTPVEGPGLVVVLRHGTRPVPEVEKESLQVGEQDVNAVLNALRAAGAEALALVGKGTTAPERVTAVTGIVDSGDSLSVNGVLFKPPYRILAVGHVTALRGQLFQPDGVVKRAALDTLGMIEVHDAPRVEIPAARLAATFKFAQPRPELIRVVRRLPAPRPAAPLQAKAEPAPALPLSAPRPLVTESAKPTPPPAAAVRPAEPAKEPAPKEAVAKEEAPKEAARKETPPVKPAPRPAPGPDRPAVPAVETAVLVKGPVFGGKGLAKYHVAGCRFGERLADGDRVQFRSAAEAVKDGRVACPVCAKPKS